MAFQPCPGIAQLEMVYTASGQPCENVFHVMGLASYDEGILTTILEELSAWHAAHVVTSQSAEVFLQKLVGTDLGSETGARLDLPVSPPRQGTGSAAPLPNNVTLAIKWGTGLRGRSSRGRTYIIGLTEGALGSDAQEVTSAFAGNILAVYDHLLTDTFTTSGVQLCVLSRRHNNALRAAGVGIPITSTSLADPFIDSQRRRLPAHNRHR